MYCTDAKGWMKMHETMNREVGQVFGVEYWICYITNGDGA